MISSDPKNQPDNSENPRTPNPIIKEDISISHDGGEVNESHIPDFKFTPPPPPSTEKNQ